ncbi:sine oculis-binding protein homolog isoform X1 [Atheta coriaria]|uniref:sine oculis-binding protein homolog isoform X1 n=2 Tax=Dalotia coriaria TaxID=877792 RepID=UPI0031F3AF34
MEQTPPKLCGVRLRSQNKIEEPPKTRSVTVAIKRESSDDDFKEYAETAMNELLGWYGYSNNNNKLINKMLQMNSKTDEHDKTDKPQQVETRRSSGNSSETDSPKSAEMCGWCGKTVEDPPGLSSNDAVFCSELCFSQSRRANFKKNKTCDWCKHVRHTVSYVDFQDGASQLQFCSDKCLNQYKMHIFCRETRAHLEMNPHLLNDDTSSGLITPDLWMRNCRSPGSRTSSPQPVMHVDEPQTSPLPLITVAHPSKLLVPEKTPPPMKRKRTKKRAGLPPNKTSDVAQDLRVRRHHTFTETNTNRDFPELAARLCANGPEPREQTIPVNITTVPPPPPPFPHQRPFLPAMGVPRAGILPPVTVMVPYPVLLPVPVPIPIPLPFSAFLQAANLRNTPLTQNGAPPSVEESVKHSDDEEIVVDDDSRLNTQSTSGDPVDTPQNSPLRLRKRKSSENPSYKHKKSLSV